MKRSHFALGVIGVLGIIGVLVGEFLMHFNPNGYTSGVAFVFFKTIPTHRIMVGHFLSALSMPFYFSAYTFVYIILAEARPKMAKWFLAIAVYIFTIGGVWIGSRILLSIMVKENFLPGIEVYSLYIESLLQLLRFGIVVISILFSVIVWKGKTILPKWMAFLNQVVFLGIVFGLFFFVPVIGNYLVPTAMNVAHLAFFSLILFLTLK